MPKGLTQALDRIMLLVLELDDPELLILIENLHKEQLRRSQKKGNKNSDITRT